jgi:hypothetical protein
MGQNAVYNAKVIIGEIGNPITIPQRMFGIRDAPIIIAKNGTPITYRYSES